MVIVDLSTHSAAHIEQQDLSLFRFAALEFDEHFIGRGDEVNIVDERAVGCGLPAQDIHERITFFWLGERARGLDGPIVKSIHA